MNKVQRTLNWAIAVSFAMWIIIMVVMEALFWHEYSILIWFILVLICMYIWYKND